MGVIFTLLQTQKYGRSLRLNFTFMVVLLPVSTWYVTMLKYTWLFSTVSVQHKTDQSDTIKFKCTAVQFVHFITT